MQYLILRKYCFLCCLESVFCPFESHVLRTQKQENASEIFGAKKAQNLRNSWN